METISRIDLLQRLAEMQGNAISQIKMKTNARAKKTNNPHGLIEKISNVLVEIGFSYKNAVAEQAKKEGVEPRPLQERRWGQRIAGTPLVEHKGKHYLERKVESVLSTPIFLADGVEIDKSEIEEFLPKRKESSTQDNLKEKIILRDVSLTSILEIVLGGTNYKVV